MHKLKILFVSHGILGNDSGVARVHFELKQEYEKAGHKVDKVDFKDLFPKGRNLFQKLFEPPFTAKVLKYLRKNADKYDIIDANCTNIIYPKKAFGFKGLLFVRSHGIPPLYKKAVSSQAFLNSLADEEKKKTIKNKLGSFVRSFHDGFYTKDFYASIKYADIVHCLNQSEQVFFTEMGISKDKLALIPNGLPKKYLNSFAVTNTDRATTSSNISFIGAWHYIKGIQDWRKLSKILTQIKSLEKIILLGSATSADFVKQFFDRDIFSFLTIIPTYKPDQLPELLKSVKVGIYTSYMEGFGYTVLEQLASGIPVVAYNVPGIADFILQIDSSYLVEPGEIKLLADEAQSILQMNKEDYQMLSSKCIEISKRYTLEDVALVFLKTYQESLEKINVRG